MLLYVYLYFVYYFFTRKSTAYITDTVDYAYCCHHYQCVTAPAQKYQF